MNIDTTSYKWWRNGREPNGVDYYSFEVWFDSGKRTQTYLFDGDYNEGLNKVKGMYKNITKICVGV